MNLTDLKRKSVTDLVDMSREMGIDNVARSRKQEVIAAILRKHAKGGEDIYGDGTLERLQDGLVSYVQQTAHTLQDPTTYMFHPARYGASTFALATALPGRYGRQKMANAILLY